MPAADRLGPLLQAFEEFQQISERLAAMGDGKFLLRREFGERFAERSIQEQGIIAEAALAAGLEEDDSIRAALHHGQNPSSFGQGDDANIMRRTVAGWNLA